jgi:hypothetical protein
MPGSPLAEDEAGVQEPDVRPDEWRKIHPRSACGGGSRRAAGTCTAGTGSCGTGRPAAAPAPELNEARRTSRAWTGTSSTPTRASKTRFGEPAGAFARPIISRTVWGSVLIPTEEVVELRNGKKVTSKRLLYPGYVMVQMAMDDEIWHHVKNTPRVTGFVGGGNTPVPLTPMK